MHVFLQYVSFIYWYYLSDYELHQILAIKLLSCVPNSMADERTVSIFTRINTPLRNAQQLDTIADIAQITQYYRFDPEVSNYVQYCYT